MIRLIFLLFAAYWVSACDGKEIRNVNIKVYDIFNKSGFEVIKAASGLKINTRESIVRRLLLFKEGDLCQTLKLNETERKLRSLGVFRSVSIFPSEVNEKFVDINVEIQDNWTITFKGSLDSQKLTPQNFGIQEKNLFGGLTNLNIKWSNKDLYEEWEALLEDRSFSRGDSKYSIIFSDKSVGQKYGFKYDDSIIDLVKKKGLIFSLISDETIFKRRLDEKPYRKDFLHGKILYERQWPVSNSSWLRQSIGFRFERKELIPKNQNSSSPLEYEWLGPMLKLSFIRPKFKSIDYFNYFNFIEDIDLGFSATSEAFVSPGISNNKTLGIINAVSGGYAPNENMLWFWGLKHQFRFDEFSKFNNNMLEISYSFYNFFEDRIFKKPGAVLTQINILASRNLDLDREFALGGEKGLLGYKNNSLSDKNIAYSKIELRNTLVENFRNLISLGSSLFIEFGSSSSLFENLKDNYLANIGFGLRIFLPDISPPRVFRLDFALPLVENEDIKSFEIRFTASEENKINKSLFEEPELFDQFQNLGLLD